MSVPCPPGAVAPTADPAAADAAALAQARQEWQDLVYAVSHDLRAPLRHITAYVQVIEEDFPGLPPELAAHLATLAAAARKMDAQLQGLTQLSRAGQRPLQLQAVALQAALADALAALAREPGGTGCAGCIDLQPVADGLCVRADAAALQDVLQELLRNACKAVEGAAQPRISVSAARHAPGSTGALAADSGGLQAVVAVRDNGLGFDAGQAARLFQVFAKLHPPAQFPGLGLGLVRCRKLLTRMGGWVALAPAPEGGCLAQVGLPLAASEFLEVVGPGG